MSEFSSVICFARANMSNIRVCLAFAEAAESRSSNDSKTHLSSMIMESRCPNSNPRSFFDAGMAMSNPLRETREIVSPRISTQFSSIQDRKSVSVRRPPTDSAVTFSRSSEFSLPRKIENPNLRMIRSEPADLAQHPIKSLRAPQE